MNYTNIAQECGISAKTVKEYFSILEDTMLGFYLPAYTKITKRRVLQSPKFYYSDVAIPNHLLRRTTILPGTDVYGHTLEHFVIQELRAFLSYNYGEDKRFSYWHTLDNITSHDTKGLKAFGKEFPNAKRYLLSMEERPRMMNGIEIWPVCQFLSRLWAGKIV